jgi:hypothetical protein
LLAVREKFLIRLPLLLFPVVLSALQDSLPSKEKQLALDVPKDNIKMKQDKDPVNNAQLVDGQGMRDLKLKEIVFQSVDMEHTAQLVWFPAWNAPEVASLRNPQLMVSENVPPALLVCLLSSQEQTVLIYAKKNALLDTTVLLDLLHVLLALLIISNLLVDRDNASSASLERKP